MAAHGTFGLPPGVVALAGGDEFSRACEPMDTALLALAGPAPHVLIVPTAATNVHPEVAAENGRHYFERLGASAASLLVVDSETANQPSLAAALSGASLIYLTGGDPQYLLATLKGSAVWHAIVARHRAGAVVAGSGAGAMALAEQMWSVVGWTPGLGLVPGLAVLPHHAALSRRWDTGLLRRTLPGAVTLVGIDDATALLLPERRVVGTGRVSVYGTAGVVSYGAGEAVE